MNFASAFEPCEIACLMFQASQPPRSLELARTLLEEHRTWALTAFSSFYFLKLGGVGVSNISKDATYSLRMLSLNDLFFFFFKLSYRLYRCLDYVCRQQHLASKSGSRPPQM